MLITEEGVIDKLFLYDILHSLRAKAGNAERQQKGSSLVQTTMPTRKQDIMSSSPLKYKRSSEVH